MSMTFFSKKIADEKVKEHNLNQNKKDAVVEEETPNEEEPSTKHSKKTDAEKLMGNK